MRIVVQRVSQASVQVDQKKIGEIQQGLVLFVCFEPGDDEKVLKLAAKKIAHLRVFDDDSNKMNLNLSQVNGKVLSISQFTLSWDGSGGNRPSFEKSMSPQEARLKYALFNKELVAQGLEVETGSFGSMMVVTLTNDGPVTFLLDFNGKTIS